MHLATVNLGLQAASQDISVTSLSQLTVYSRAPRNSAYYLSNRSTFLQ